MKNKDKIFFTSSVFSLLLYTLVNKEWQNSVYVLHSRIPKSIRTQLKSKVRKVYVDYSGSTYTHSIIVNKIIKLIIVNSEYFRLYFSLSKYKNFDCWGNDEMYAAIPFRKNGFTIVEDGTFNYQTEEYISKRVNQASKYLLVYRLFPKFKKYLSYGYSQCVETAYLTGLKKTPTKLEGKVRIVKIRELWKSISVQEHNSILKVFGLSNKLVNDVSQFPILLITQPIALAEGGVFSMEEKIDLYRSMLKDISLKDVLIKTHYAEKTNYSSSFPEAKIVDTPTPFELFDLIGYCPTKVITISSGVALRYSDSPEIDVDFKGTEIDERLVKMYGVIKL